MSSIVTVLCLVPLSAAAILLVGGFALHPYNVERQGRLPKHWELPQSALLVGVAAVIWSATRDTPFAALAGLICLGMACGFVGDLFMANVFRHHNHVLFGMGTFAVGHLLYLLGLREIAVAFGLNRLEIFVATTGLTWLLALILWRVLVFQSAGSSLQ